MFIQMYLHNHTQLSNLNVSSRRGLALQDDRAAEVWTHNNNNKNMYTHNNHLNNNTTTNDTRRSSCRGLDGRISGGKIRILAAKHSYIYIYIYVCMYVCMYVCIYIYIYRVQGTHAPSAPSPWVQVRWFTQGGFARIIPHITISRIHMLYMYIYTYYYTPSLSLYIYIYI